MDKMVDSSLSLQLGGESGDDKFAWSMSGIDSELDWNFYVVYTSHTSLRKKEL